VFDGVYTPPEEDVMRERNSWTLFEECPV